MPTSLDNPRLLKAARPGKCPAEADRAAWFADWCQRAPVAVDGAGGGATLLTLLTDAIVGLELEPDVASEIALEVYNPRCKPPWDDPREWQHKVEEAELNRLGREPGDLVAAPPLATTPQDEAPADYVNQGLTLGQMREILDAAERAHAEPVRRLPAWPWRADPARRTSRVWQGLGDSRDRPGWRLGVAAVRRVRV